ncbi:hypothetical protein ebA1365 [Aromatoleum aromaticum EbN1]|uniref:Uncharacterized protein n=1 Tax=Aromatoleum aromaticum (strain DSM 19018 / LMG 30748 / EbN1) TaxID=76114 RepID=Q5P746_AROAE|nr:hypothetical protein ebA1365 [Aromatoleum aromaticum EbN1]
MRRVAQPREPGVGKPLRPQAVGPYDVREIGQLPETPIHWFHRDLRSLIHHFSSTKTAPPQPIRQAASVASSRRNRTSPPSPTGASAAGAEASYTGYSNTRLPMPPSLWKRALGLTAINITLLSWLAGPFEFRSRIACLLQSTSFRCASGAGRPLHPHPDARRRQRPAPQYCELRGRTRRDLPLRHRSVAVFHRSGRRVIAPLDVAGPACRMHARLAFDRNGHRRLVLPPHPHHLEPFVSHFTLLRPSASSCSPPSGSPSCYAQGSGGISKPDRTKLFPDALQ